MLQRSLLVLFSILAAGCASKPPANAPDAAGFRLPTEGERTLILASGRSAVESKGCKAAAPRLRVIAAMGEGFESAQHELGECLLKMTDENDAESALFRQEALFWLRRAAFAGNARAQRSLVFLHAEEGAMDHDAGEALKWALVYEANPEADLFGYKALPRTLVAGLKSDLGPAFVSEALAFAEGFDPFAMDAYEAPQSRNASRSERGGQGGGSGERRERRRRP